MKLATSAARRVLTIAVTPVFASVLLPPICIAFAKVDPTVEIRVRDVPRPEIQGLVERGEADVGYAIFLKPTAGIELTPLFSFQLMYLAAAGALSDHADGQKARARSGTGSSGRGVSRAAPRGESMGSLPWANMPPMPLIALAPDTPVQEVIETRLARIARAGRPAPSGQVCQSMLTMIGMVGAGLGAAILPSMVVPVCPASRFDLRRLTSPATRLRFHQISKKGHRLPPIAEPFLETMVRVVTEQCARQPA